MDRDRWPDEIARYVDEVSCPKCGAPRSRVMVTVRFQAPVWNILGNCFGCQHIHLWQHIDIAGAMPPKPESIPLPSWVKEL